MVAEEEEEEEEEEEDGGRVKRAKPLEVGGGKAGKVAAFEQLLREAKVGPFSDYFVTSMMLERDPRFQAIENEEERKTIFENVAMGDGETEEKKKEEETMEEEEDPKEVFARLVKSKLKEMPKAPSLYDLRRVVGSHPVFAKVGKLARKMIFEKVVGEEKEKRAVRRAEKVAARKAAKKGFVKVLLSLRDPRLDGDSRWKHVLPRVQGTDEYAALPPKRARDVFFDLVDMLRSRGRREQKMAAASQAAHSAQAKAEFAQLLHEFVRYGGESYDDVQSRLGDDPRWAGFGLSEDDRVAAYAAHIADLGTSDASALAEILQNAVSRIRLDWSWDQALAALSSGPDASVAAAIQSIGLSRQEAADVYRDVLSRACERARSAFLDMVDEVAPYGSSATAYDVSDALDGADPRYERAEQDATFNPVLFLEGYLNSDAQKERRSRAFGAASKAKPAGIRQGGGAYGEESSALDALLSDDDDDAE